MESLGCTVETNTGLPRWLRGKNQSAMQETQIQSLGQEDPLEEGMATHSSILVWRIPWAEEPGELLSMGSKRVGHDWSDWAHTQKLIEHCKSTLLQENLQKRNEIQVTSEHFFKTLNAEDNGATYRIVAKPHSACCHSGGDQKIWSPTLFERKKNASTHTIGNQELKKIGAWIV